MKLETIMRLDRESKSDFFARTYWTYHDRVFVYNNQQEVSNPSCLPAQVWSKNRARKYLDTLDEKDEE